MEDDALRRTAISLAAALVIAVVAGGFVLYARARKTDAAPEPQPADERDADDGRVEEPVPPIVGPDVLAAQSAPAAFIPTHGFAAGFDEDRVVMGALEVLRRNLFSCDFVAKVVNQSREPLLCTVSGRTRRASMPVPPGSFAIHAQSAAAVAVTAPLRLPFRLRSLDLCMESSTLRASAQADVPVPLGARIVAAVAAAALGAIAASVVLSAARPRIAAFTAPARVLAGDPFTATFDLAGWGGGRYAIARGGRRVADGMLGAKSGTLTFFTSSRPARYDVALAMSGPLGRASKTLRIRAVGRRVTVAPAIEALAVDPAVASSGSAFAVRYTASAAGGEIALVDAAGITVERAPYSASGISTMRAPAVTTPTQYDVLLDVSRAGAASRASVGLLVLAHALATPQPAPPNPTDIASAPQVFRLPSHVVGGRVFTIAILAHPAHLVLTLANFGGAVVVSEPVASAARWARMLAPRVNARVRFVLLARFRSGSAQQVLLSPLVIYPR